MLQLRIHFLVVLAVSITALAAAVERTSTAHTNLGKGATDDGPMNRTVQRLIEQLDDDEFQKREEATKQLQEMGRAIVPLLEAALPKTDSLEVRRRLERVLDWYRVRLEWYTDRALFRKHLKNAVTVVTFDDIDTSKEDDVSFAANRYEKRHGIIITGQGGQYVGRTFGFPKDFPPVSAPNMYAPGPKALRNAGQGAGGCKTNVTFTFEGKPAVTAAFGAVFIDADYPEVGPSSLAVFDRNNKRIGDVRVVSGPDASQIFCGVIAKDGAGAIVPSIARVHLVNGGNWPGVEPGEGVTLDDFVFAKPVQVRE